MGKTALITGASGGIGLAFARRFARDKYDVVLVARSEGKLREVAAELQAQHGIRAIVIASDLSQPGAPQAIFDQLQAAGVAVDVLVNNAGFANYGAFTEIETAKDLELLHLNIVALTHLCKLFLKPMLARGSGHILNVASTAAFLPGPLMAAYYASKAYVLSLSEALAEELVGTAVTVTALCPGPTESGFQKRAAMEDSKLVQGGLMDVEVVVEQGYQAMLRGQRVVVPGMMNKLTALLPRFLPRQMATRMVKGAQERTGH